MSTQNPFQAPSSNPQAVGVPSVQLAGRIARLGAAILDGLFAGVVAAPVMFLIIWPLTATENPTSGTLLVANLLSSAVVVVVYCLINGYFLSQTGQTIGKKLVGVRIVMMDSGAVPSLGASLGLRYALIVALSQVPVVGGLFALVNVLFIFRSDRRCIHDLIAGTQVVAA